MKNTFIVALSCVSCAVASPPVFPGNEVESWVGEPRLEMALQFGGGTGGAPFIRDFSLAFGVASRFSMHSLEAAHRETILPVTGLSLSWQTGFQPMLLGSMPNVVYGMAVDGEESSFSWGWAVGAIAAGAAAITLLNSGDSSVNASVNGGTSPESSRVNAGGVNGIGPSDGDGECDLASNNGGEFTVVEGECVN